jgi:hypothetical protein
MPVNFIDNFGSTYININECRSFNQPITTTLVGLSSQVCSEVIIYNKTGVTISIYDSGYFDDSNSILLDDNDTITIRGITNTEQVSAKSPSAGSSNGLLYFRTQFYSMLPQR